MRKLVGQLFIVDTPARVTENAMLLRRLKVGIERLLGLIVPPLIIDLVRLEGAHGTLELIVDVHVGTLAIASGPRLTGVTSPGLARARAAVCTSVTDGWVGWSLVDGSINSARPNLVLVKLAQAVHVDGRGLEKVLDGGRPLLDRRLQVLRTEWFNYCGHVSLLSSGLYE